VGDVLKGALPMYASSVLCFLVFTCRLCMYPHTPGPVIYPHSIKHQGSFDSFRVSMEKGAVPVFRNRAPPKLLHPSADDSKIFDRYLNGMPQNGKCLVNVTCDSWSMFFSGTVESVKGS
jgi:hypothetical protein